MPCFADPMTPAYLLIIQVLPCPGHIMLLSQLTMLSIDRMKQHIDLAMSSTQGMRETWHTVRMMCKLGSTSSRRLIRRWRGNQRKSHHLQLKIISTHLAMVMVFIIRIISSTTTSTLDKPDMMHIHMRRQMIKLQVLLVGIVMLMGLTLTIMHMVMDRVQNQ